MIPNIWSHGTEVCSSTLTEECYADLLISLICRYPQCIFKTMDNLTNLSGSQISTENNSLVTQICKISG